MTGTGIDELLQQLIHDPRFRNEFEADRDRARADFLSRNRSARL